MTKSEIREALGTIADYVARKRDGTWTAKRSYFYHHGQSAASFALDVKAAVEAAGGTIELGRSFDAFARWPKTSFFVAEFKVVSGEDQASEIAYRVPGQEWERKSFKSEAEAERWVGKLLDREGSDVEIRWAANGVENQAVTR